MIAAVIGVAVGMLVFLCTRLVLGGTQGGWARRRIAPHVELRAVEATPVVERQHFLQRLEGLLGATDRRLGGTRAWRTLGQLVERADVPLRPAELFYIVAGGGLLLGLLFAAATGSFVSLVWAPLLVMVAAWSYLSIRASRRLRAFDDQLPELLTELASALRVGHSLVQALQAVTDDARPPIGKELRRVLAETRLGRPLELALADMAVRLPSKELDFVLTAITIQRQVGGSLAGLFEIVSDTVRERHHFHRKLRSLTAMGKLSAYVVAAMPFGLGLLLSARDHAYMAPLLKTHVGNVLLVVGGTAMVVGGLLLKKIVAIKG